jgi:hypothetical protein
MIRSSPMKVLGLILAVVVMCGGASCPGKVADMADRIPDLGSIATATNANRALVIAQAIRVGYRDQLARRVAEDGIITPTELQTLNDFDAKDARFTGAWAQAHTAVQVWAAMGGRMPAEFSEAYTMLERYAAEWVAEHGAIKPVVIEGRP